MNKNGKRQIGNYVKWNRCSHVGRSVDPCSSMWYHFLIVFIVLCVSGRSYTTQWTQQSIVVPQKGKFWKMFLIIVPPTVDPSFRLDCSEVRYHILFCICDGISRDDTTVVVPVSVVEQKQSRCDLRSLTYPIHCTHRRPMIMRMMLRWWLLMRPLLTGVVYPSIVVAAFDDTTQSYYCIHVVDPLDQ